MNRAEIWRSLRTDSLSVALRRLPSVAAKIVAEIEHARLIVGLPVDATIIRPLTYDQTTIADHAINLADKAITFDDAYARYIDDPTRAWSPSTRESYQTCRKLAVSVIGSNVPVASISRAHCRDLLNVLRFLPINAAKRFPKLSPREAADRICKIGGTPTISAANANSLMTNLSTFLNWAVNEEMLARNPARGLRLPDQVAKRDKRLPFSPEQLRMIFDAPLYRGCIDGARGYAKSGNQRPRNARFWVPLIGLFTGARLGEICQLDVTDIRSVDGIDCVIITLGSLVGSSDKRLKTGASDRFIPIHPLLFRCGLLDFVNDTRRAGEPKLFSDIEIGTNGSRSVAMTLDRSRHAGRRLALRDDQHATNWQFGQMRRHGYSRIDRLQRRQGQRPEQRAFGRSRSFHAAFDERQCTRCNRLTAFECNKAWRRQNTPLAYPGE